MSSSTHTVARAEPDGHPRSRRHPFDVRASLVDAGVVLGWFLLAGVVGAVLWWRLVDLPLDQRVQGGTGMGPEELVKQVQTDGWFFVIAAVGGLVSGAALVAWRRRDPVLTVLLVVIGGALAAVVMVRLGLLLGPDDPQSVLRTRPVGATAPTQLALQAPGIAWVWAIAGALGCLFVLWVTPNRDEGDD